MKILQVINGLNTGGAEKLLLDAIPLLNQQGVNVDLLILDDKEYPYLKELKKMKCCEIHTIGGGNIYNPLNVFKIIPFLKGYDIIHVHLFPAQYWVAIAKAISFASCKLIFTEHNTTNRRMKNIFFKYFDKVVYRIYNKIICISPEIRDILIKYTSLNPKKFEIIRNGIDIQKIKSAKRIDWIGINPTILDTDYIIIQVAGFRVQKDQKTTIKALSLLPKNVKLVLVGDGDLRSELETMAKSLHLDNRVFFLGIRLDVPNLLKSSYISVVSSHWEGMPLAAMEGMAAHIPVVASRVAGITELVENVGVLFEESDAVELASIITALIRNKDYYNEVSNRCSLYSQQFDIKKMIESIVTIYEKLSKS